MVSRLPLYFERKELVADFDVFVSDSYSLVVAALVADLVDLVD